MFGFGKSVYRRQLKRAVLVQNAVMLALFSHFRKQIGADGHSSANDAIAAGINYLFGKKAENNFGTEGRALYRKVLQTVADDSDLEKLIVRILFDVASLSAKLKNSTVLSEFPRIIARLDHGREAHPEIFEDWKEVHFKTLFEKFADKYDPELKRQSGSLFR
jgi:hypothetical protein